MKKQIYASATDVKLVTRFLMDLKETHSWANVLNMPKKFNLSAEQLKTSDNWFDFVNTSNFVNYFISMNPGFYGKFTSVERIFRHVRENMRNELKATKEVSS